MNRHFVCLAFLLAALAPARAGLIPLDTFAAAPQLSHARLSPNGRYVASLQYHEGE